jgi:hypothetical protein
MLSMDESVELRPLPLSVTKSLIRMPGLLEDDEVGGGGVLPSLRGGNGCRAPFAGGPAKYGEAPGVVGACVWGDEEERPSYEYALALWGELLRGGCVA